MNRKNIRALLAALLALGLLSGCGGEAGSSNAETPGPAASRTNTEPPSSSEAEPWDGPAEFSFADVSNLEFWFGSGAGAWRTVLTIAEDGSFEGQYSDSEMGSTGAGFPDGSCYLCDFTGKFTEPEKRNDYTYSVEIERLETARQPGGEEILDGIKYMYSEPYGLDGGSELLFYLPGAPTEALPEGYMQWAGGYGVDAGEALPFYGLYNVDGDLGFSSYEK